MGEEKDQFETAFENGKKEWDENPLGESLVVNVKFMALSTQEKNIYLDGFFAALGLSGVVFEVQKFLDKKIYTIELMKLSEFIREEITRNSPISWNDIVTLTATQYAKFGLLEKVKE